MTILGLGGSGKTRLAIQAAASQRHAFADGARFVPLAALESAALVAPAIAQRLGLQPGEGEDDTDRLAAALRGRHMLLVLDNLEQVAGVAAVVARLLDGAPELTILATSRERLGLRSEWALDVAGLGLPAGVKAEEVAASAAGALFIQSARRAGASIAPTPGEGAAIARICRHLGGHPLAIELAGAWARLLSCAEIEAELSGGLDLLSSEAHDLPERQRTIGAVLEGTWRMLPPAEADLLARLSLFRGGFDREAGVQVAGATLARLAALANRSLLSRSRDGRYEIHEFVRQYAGGRLALAGAADEAARRHRAYFFGLVERAEPHMKGPDESAWMDRLEADHDNLRAALEAGEAGEVARACEVLRWFWYMRGHFGEGLRWMERALAAADAAGLALPPLRRGKLLQGAGIFADEQGDYARAAARYAEALAVYEAAGDQRGLQATTNSLGILRWAMGDYAGAQACFERCLALCRELGHAWGEANALNSLGTALQGQGDAAAALARYEQALAVARPVD